ncbi:F-box only protein 6-like [Hetaerina americana]|uniref:F-box only protein 6-like n=1 Tax=Hetaerina americana TaxID=62018 RepID=UPI003A7F3F14
MGNIPATNSNDDLAEKGHDRMDSRGSEDDGNFNPGDGEIQGDKENGLFLSSYYIPEEVLGHILSFVDSQALVFSCRFVCHNWKCLVDSLALKWRAERIGFKNLKENPGLLCKLNWIDYYWLTHKLPFECNLLKNNCGQNSFESWVIVKNGGDGWKVESCPQGTESIPPVNYRGESHPDFMGLSSCFVTSFSTCTKFQVINLNKNGLTPNFMDNVQPPIQISEWTVCRHDCGCIYELNVSLLDENMKTVTQFKANENFHHLPREIWHQVSHIFQNYGPGVRHIRFEHSGVDSQFWKGHYGSKMSGGSVRVLDRIKENTWDAPLE